MSKFASYGFEFPKGLTSLPNFYPVRVSKDGWRKKMNILFEKSDTTGEKMVEERVEITPDELKTIFLIEGYTLVTPNILALSRFMPSRLIPWDDYSRVGVETVFDAAEWLDGKNWMLELDCTYHLHTLMVCVIGAIHHQYVHGLMQLITGKPPELVKPFFDSQGCNIEYPDQFFLTLIAP